MKTSIKARKLSYRYGGAPSWWQKYVESGLKPLKNLRRSYRKYRKWKRERNGKRAE